MNKFRLIDEIIGEYGHSDLTAWAMRFFLRNPYESMIVVDREGKVVFMDRGSEKFCGLKQGEAKGRPVVEFFPNSILPVVAQTGMPRIGRIFQVEHKGKIGSVYPLIKNGEVIGAIGRLVFSSFEEIERINKEMEKLKKEINHVRAKQEDEHKALYTFENIIGQSQLITDAVEIARKIAFINTGVLIVGESGTGKELFAHSIHNFVDQKKPFVKVNCPAIPFEIADSELFGYEGGTFSGALTSGKVGKFEMAHDGTVFLDEIASLPLSIQAKLLRVLQEKEVQRLGSTKTKKINFRLVATTNTDLKTLVNAGKFRDDLYYRVTKAIIHIAPLRERKADVPLYVYHYLKKVNESLGTRIRSISDQAMRRLLSYPWPGNIRELINVLEQAALKTWKEEELTEEHLPRDLLSAASETVNGSEGDTRTMREEIERKEKELMCHALMSTAGNKTEAALLLGMPRSTFYEKIKKYNLRLQLQAVLQ